MVRRRKEAPRKESNAQFRRDLKKVVARDREILEALDWRSGRTRLLSQSRAASRG